jgi:hypothetical protein
MTSPQAAPSHGDRPPRPARPGYAGILLLVLLIGVAIIFALTFMPGGSADTAQQAKEHANESVAMFSGAAVATDVRGYIALNGVPPASIDDLREYRGGDYLDPWGTPMRIDFHEGPRRNTLASITVHSAGPDTQWDTDDDQASEHPINT